MAVPAEVEELPRTNVRRVVKGKLAELTKDAVTKKEISVHKEALMAFSESAKIFIHYLSATANDICRESNRQTVNAEDVLKAVEEIDFPEFLEPLKGALEEYRKDTAIKKQEAKEKAPGRKRKPEAFTEENEEIRNVTAMGTEDNLAAAEDHVRDEDDTQELETI